jgi:hypothetical protein
MRGPGSTSFVRDADKRGWRVRVEQQPPSNPGNMPRLNQCFLCRAWKVEKNLSPIEIPDQVGWIEKKACQECLNKVMDEVKNEA